MKDNTRGQLESGWPPGALLLVVLTIGLVVAETIIDEVSSVDESTLETACLGVWGCGTPSLLETAVTVALLIVVIGTIAYGVRGGLPR